MKASRFSFKRKVAVGVVVCGLLAAGAGVAVAAFSGSGHGTGSVHVGKGTTGWKVVQTGPATGTLYPATTPVGPNTPVAILHFKVTNTTPGNLWINAAKEVSASVPFVGPTTTAVTHTTHARIIACKHTWIQILSITGPPGSLRVKTGTSFDIFVHVVLRTVAGVNQNGCQGFNPQVNLMIAP